MSTPVDHTGERINNRLITGRGTLRETISRSGEITRTRREWRWKWRCVNCGAEGENLYTILTLHYHKCPKIERPIENDNSGKICSDQCKGCGHYRQIGTGGWMVCNYLLDTGHMRPKANLITDVCPGRDTDYRAPRATPVSLLIPLPTDPKAYY